MGFGKRLGVVLDSFIFNSKLLFFISRSMSVESDPTARLAVGVGLPATVNASNVQKFLSHVKRLSSEKLGFDNFVISPAMADDGTVGALFFEFARVEDCDKGVQVLHKWKVSKADEMQVFPWSIWKTTEDLPNEYREEEVEEEATIDLSNPFLMDPMARPQFIVKHGNDYDVEWYWFDLTRLTENGENAEKKLLELIRKPTADKSNNVGQWSEVDRHRRKLQPGVPKLLPMWSPRGTLLISQSLQGVKVWGGRAMQLISSIELMLSDVESVVISPNEKVLVVKSKTEWEFWNILSGKKLRALPCRTNDLAKFNTDDTIAGLTLTDTQLAFYDASTMKTLTQTEERVPYSIQTDTPIVAWEWSPTNPSIVAVALEGDNNTGMQVTVFQVDTLGNNLIDVQQMIRRNFFGAERINLLWNPDGSALTAKVESKIGKVNESIEYCIFRVGGSKVTAEQLKTERKAKRFVWQPSGKHFGVLIEGSKAAKPALHIYSVGATFKKIFSHDTDADAMFWSQNTNRLVAVNFEKSGLEFFKIDAKDQVVFLGRKEHSYVTDCEWDPTGRVFCTTTSQLSYGTDNRMIFWNVNGETLKDEKMTRLSHMQWRPVPRTLSLDEINSVRRELPAISSKYMAEEVDKQRRDEEAKNKELKAKEDKYKATLSAIRHEFDVKRKYAEKRELLRKSAPAAKRQEQEKVKFAQETIEEIEEIVEVLSETQL